MAFSIFSVVILALLKGVSDAAVDKDCQEVSNSFVGDKIEGAGSSFDTTGDWSLSARQDRGITECTELCLNEPEAKGWSLRYFDNQKCSCFKTITDSKRDPTFKSGKFCQCDLKYHPSILHSNSFSLPAYCQLPDGNDVAPTSPLPNGASCNLTCTGSYVGTPGALECRARDWKIAGNRIKMAPNPICRLNSTAVMYASIGGGLVAVLILFLLLVCCLRQKQRREKMNAEKVVMRNARGEEQVDAGIDRRKSYKKATGHLSMDEENREADLMINGRQDGIVYANVSVGDQHPQRQKRDIGAPITMIGAPDVDPIYLEGSIPNDYGGNQYVTVDNSRS